MKATITRDALAEAAQAVKGLVSKDGLSAFSKVRLDASGCLSVTGSNGDVQVEWRANGKIDKPGTMTVPGAAFCSFVGAMPAGGVEIDDHGGKKVKMEGGGVKFTLVAGEAADFPVMAGPKDEGRTCLHIGVRMLREMIRKVRFAVLTDGTKRNLEGVNIELKDRVLGMTAADGKRLAHVEKENIADAAQPGMNITLPTKVVAILFGLVDRMGEGDIYIEIDSTSVRIVGDKWGMTAKVLADKYPNWRRVLPERMAHKAVLNRALFLDAMNCAALASDEPRLVHIVLKNGCATFEAKNAITEAKTNMPACKMDDGVTGDFRINPCLLKDALEAIDEEEVALHFDHDGPRPIKLTCALPWVAVIMPYRKEG